MTLRLPNNPATESVLLPAIALAAPVGTQLALGSTSGTGAELVYIQQKFALSQGAYPAVLLESGRQECWRNSTTTYTGSHDVLITYYNRWDESQQTLAAIRAASSLDLERIRANIETAEATSALGLNVSIYRWRISDLEKAMEKEFLGMRVLKRVATASFYILPYSVN